MKKIKEIDKKILIGLCLTIGFLILWFSTMPAPLFSNPYAEIPKQELQAAYDNDQNNFDKAVIISNLSYCDKILDDVLKRNCINTVNKQKSDIQQEDTAVSDKNNFDKAIITANSEYCYSIINSEIKNQCLTTLSPTEIPQSQPANEQAQSDKNNYDKAIILNDKSYCDKIIDLELKNTCNNEIGE